VAVVVVVVVLVAVAATPTFSVPASDLLPQSKVNVANAVSSLMQRRENALYLQLENINPPLVVVERLLTRKLNTLSKFLSAL
jgi:hypothetical protein